jgi:ABC-type Fe3+ transport system permease subunit
MSVLMFLADASSSILGGANAACGNGASCNTSTTVPTLFKSITNTMIFVIGALSVIMIIFGGVRYVISRGDAAAVKDAKNTIIYAVAGVVVAIAAFAIVNFVIKSIK